MPDHPLSFGGHTLVVLDTCVLLPPRLSDVLFDLYLEGLYFPQWTKDIEAEFLKNWSNVGKNAPNGSAQRRLDCFQAAANNRHEIFGHNKSENIRMVPAQVDPGDRHVISAALVLRAACESEADKVIVVTSNIAHMAPKHVEKLGVEVIRPGTFIDNLCEASPERVGLALNRTVNDLKNPPYTQAQLLGALSLHKATATVRWFSKQWGIPPELPATERSR